MCRKQEEVISRVKLCLAFQNDRSGDFARQGDVIGERYRETEAPGRIRLGCNMTAGFFRLRVGVGGFAFKVTRDVVLPDE